MQLLGKSHGIGAGISLSVELGALVRVLAVAQALSEIVLQEQLFVKTGLLPHISGYAHIVLCRMGVCLSAEPESGLFACRAVLSELREHFRIIGRVANHGHVLEVLGGAANH